MLTSLYRKLLPYSLRKSMYDSFLGKVVFFFRHFNVIAKSKFTYALYPFVQKNDENKAFAFMGRHGVTSYPYEYALEYKNKTINVEHDREQNLPFVNHNGRRLYFPEFYDAAKVTKDYRALLIEQDARSAHRYVRSYGELKGRTLLDVGAAEGIFALDTIELTSRVILFECMEHWQKPLKATFGKWANKVTIVEKYVGDKTSGNFVTIDDFLSTYPKETLFIKMDIEGAERIALEGARQTLANGRDIQLAICTYHRIGDPEFIDNFVKDLGFSTEFSEGLMYWNKRVSKGVIRCKK